MINDDIPACQRDCDSAAAGVGLYLWADELCLAMWEQVKFNIKAHVVLRNHTLLFKVLLFINVYIHLVAKLLGTLR